MARLFGEAAEKYRFAALGMGFYSVLEYLDMKWHNRNSWIAAICGAAALTGIMQFWLWYLQSRSLFGMGAGGDDISQWWTVHTLPIFSVILGAALGLLTKTLCGLAFASQPKQTYTWGLRVSFTVFAGTAFLVLSEKAILSELILFWWPIYLWIALVFCFSVLLYGWQYSKALLLRKRRSSEEPPAT